MKKAISIIGLVALLACGLCGCSNSNKIILTASGEGSIIDDIGVGNSSDSGNTQGGNQNQGGQAADSASLIKVGFVQVGSESDWRIAQSESVKSTFTEANGYKLLRIKLRTYKS